MAGNLEKLTTVYIIAIWQNIFTFYNYKDYCQLSCLFLLESSTRTVGLRSKLVVDWVHIIMSNCYFSLFSSLLLEDADKYDSDPWSAKTLPSRKLRIANSILQNQILVYIKFPSVFPTTFTTLSVFCSKWRN